MKKSILLVLIVSLLVSCHQDTRFNVSGIVEDAEGEILYLEHNGLLKTTVLDSVKLRTKGTFDFAAARPAYPDFYRLRIGSKFIVFAVDSCEDIRILAKNKNFASEYIVTGSEISVQIQELRKSVMDIQRKANTLNANLSVAERNEKIAEIEQDIEMHKAKAQTLILRNPRSSAAYFAIYQQVNNTFLFSPYVKSDRPFCAAVATAYHTFMPDYERSKNLYALVMDAIRSERKAKEKEAWNEILENSGKGYIDIALNDKNGTTRKLSELEGNVILIDFSAYESNKSVEYTFALRDLYNKYKSKGFEIYQVSLDRNKLLWEESVQNIPWICVRDENGINTTYAASYNISSIPTTFLMNRKGVIIARSLEFKELSTEIEKNL